jgi:hypothetical protein
MIDKLTVRIPKGETLYFAQHPAGVSLIYDKTRRVAIAKCRHHQDEPKPGCAVCDLVAKSNAADAA